MCDSYFRLHYACSMSLIIFSATLKRFASATVATQEGMYNVQHKVLGYKHTEYPVWDYCLKRFNNRPLNLWCPLSEGRNEWAEPRLVSTIHSRQMSTVES